MRGEPRGHDTIYGRNSVREALRGRRRVLQILLATGEGSEQEKSLEDEVRGWCKEAQSPTPSFVHLSFRELTARVHTPDHQSVAAEVEAFRYTDTDRLLARHTLIVALDQVQDPHNLGAVIRTAEAAGAGVVIARHRAAEVTGTVVKASAGATEHVDIAQVRNLSDFLRAAKEKGFWVYGAEAESDGDYSAQDYSYPSCFVLGSEGQGLGRRVTSFCDVVVSLPMLGRVGSLNVSVSAGVLLYEALRQRKAGSS